MSALDNLTPFAATCIPSMSCRDELLTLVVVAGRFELPRAGVRVEAAPKIAQDQPPVRVVDEYWGEPDASSLRHEGQTAYVRPGTDIYLEGLAWAPGGRPSTQGMVGVRVGAWQKAAMVFGERVWSPGLGQASPTQPLPFTSLPLTYERCFGGSPDEHNPVGRGLYASEREAIGQPLPNFEHPQMLIRGLGDRPPPMGFGPLARHWLARRVFAGTYDQAWIDHRIPSWPDDFDERFFCAASPGLCALPHLVGGESVQIVGMSPDGSYEFVLPRVHLQARFEVEGASLRRPLVLDGLAFEPELAAFTMIWRVSIPADPLRVGAVVVRLLDEWEVAA